jgi:hypothetical protein
LRSKKRALLAVHPAQKLLWMFGWPAFCKPNYHCILPERDYFSALKARMTNTPRAGDYQVMDAFSQHIEKIILQFNTRGMVRLYQAINHGYCHRAAQLIRNHPGTVLIGTGFPVKGTFESDGPIGAIAMYDVLQLLDYDPIFVCGPPLSGVLGGRFNTYEMPILEWQASVPVVKEALDKLRPALIMSIERPGITTSGRYFSMKGRDISAYTAKFDLFFDLSTCPTIAFGDGGNEIGMGNFHQLLTELPITPSITTCDELVIATVSNWGVYGVITELSRLLGKNLLAEINLPETLSYLMSNGCLDGVTAKATATEDGFPMAVGHQIIRQLQGTLSPNSVNNLLPV